MLANVGDIPNQLASRTVVAPADFEKTMKLREETHHQAPYAPQGDTAADLFPSTFYLASVDGKHRRMYNRMGDMEATETASNGVH